MLKLGAITVALAGLSLAATPVMADRIADGLARAAQSQGGSGYMPPNGYAGQTWRTPNNCDYSRAGRPGETVWYLISNTAHRGCKTYIVQKGFSDVY
jgi:uncharacterized membrane protein